MGNARSATARQKVELILWALGSIVAMVYTYMI